MTDNQDQKQNDQGLNVQYHVPPDLEYVYRDVFHIFVGSGEVIIEFGNRHPSMPERATIANRVVLSVANAIDLQQRLKKTIEEAQERLRQQIKQQQQQLPPRSG